MAVVKLMREAAEDIRDLDGSARVLVLKALNMRKTNPEQRGQPLGSTAIGNLTSLRKLVVGNRDYRIVYRCLDDNRIAVVLVVARRADNEVYELAVSRLRMHNDPEMRQLAENIRDLTP